MRLRAEKGASGSHAAATQPVPTSHCPLFKLSGPATRQRLPLLLHWGACQTRLGWQVLSP